MAVTICLSTDTKVGKGEARGVCVCVFRGVGWGGGECFMLG